MIEWAVVHLAVLLLLNLGLAALLHKMALGVTQVEAAPRLGALALEGVVVGAETLLHGPATDRPCAVWWLSLPYAPVDRHQLVSDWVSTISLRLGNQMIVRIALPPSIVAYIGNPVLGTISDRDRSMEPAPKIGGIPAPGVKMWEELVCIGDHVYIAGEFEGPEFFAGDDPMRSSGTGAEVETWTMVRRGAIHVGSARDLRFLGRVSRWRLRHAYIFFIILSGSYAVFAGSHLGLWES